MTELIQPDEREHLDQLSLLLRTDTNYESKVMAEFAYLLGQIDRMKKRTELIGHQNRVMRDALVDIAGEDYRGNRPAGATKAYQALTQCDQLEIQSCDIDGGDHVG